MFLGIDTDVLVNWMVTGSPHHESARQLFRSEIRKGTKLGLTPQVIFEFLHICTDRRRFQHPLRMEEATSVVSDLWNGREIFQIVPQASVIYETVEWLNQLTLGRKRILDTALAVTLKQAGVTRIATLSKQDFQVFPFLEVVVP